VAVSTSQVERVSLQTPRRKGMAPAFSGDECRLWAGHSASDAPRISFLLSTKILSDFQAENKDLNKMPFRMIKTILKTRYEIETPSAGLFFENQPKEYQTTGGHKSKFAFIKK